MTKRSHDSLGTLNCAQVILRANLEMHIVLKEEREGLLMEKLGLIHQCHVMDYTGSPNLKSQCMSCGCARSTADPANLSSNIQLNVTLLE